MRFLEEAPAKGLPQCAAMRPGFKGCGLRYPRSPREIETISDLSIRFPATPPLFVSFMSLVSCLMSNPTLVNNMEKTFEDYFSFEAILGDLVKWRIAGKDVGGTLPSRKMWSRAGVKERKGVDPAVVRKQAIFRTVRRACGGARVAPEGEWRSRRSATLPAGEALVGDLLFYPHRHKPGKG